MKLSLLTFVLLLPACASTSDAPGNTADSGARDSSAVDSAHDGASPTDGASPNDSAAPEDSAAPNDGGTADTSTPDSASDSAAPDSAPPSDGGAHACSSPSDCRLFSYPCNGCHCLPLRTDDPNPTCPTPPESCFIDPCEGKQPTCTNGHCAIQ